jgi:1,2-diacylglycerol 3-beta-galactosyltransferase
LTEALRPSTILLLVAETGAGHRSTATALRQAIQIAASESNQGGGCYRSEVIDAFTTCGTLPVRKLGALYAAAICYAPWLYSMIFHLTNHPWSFRLVERLLYRLIHRGLAHLFTSMRPALIVSLHPLLNHVSLRVLDELQMRVPLVTVMTDLVTPHRGWTAPAVDACIVPTEQARIRCQQQGMAAERIQVLGLPIDLKFSRPGVPRTSVCQQFGLDPAMPIVLLMGGGAGAGRLEKLVRALWQADLPIQLLVVAGQNARLQRRLEQRALRLPDHLQQRCRVLGFVQQVPDLMQAADLLITKAGPSTICEAVACKLPLMLSGCIPGQEEGNVGYVCEQGIGILAETPEELVASLRGCLQPHSPLLEQIRANMARMQNPQAAFSIASYLLVHLS